MASPTTAELQAYAAAAAQREGVPVNMFLWQIGKESSWNPNAKSDKSSAAGIAQFTKGTAADFNLNPYDPYASLDAAAKYDAQLYKQNGSWGAALEKYGTLNNATPADQKAFTNALGADQASGSTGMMDGVTGALSGIWNNSMFGLAGATANNLTGNGAANNGSWDFQKYFTSGAIVILGIVVVAIAILSNKQVQSAVTSAVTKGA
jgi:hypothetical protein